MSCHVCLYESGGLCMSFVWSGLVCLLLSSMVWFVCCCVARYGEVKVKVKVKVDRDHINSF